MFENLKYQFYGGLFTANAKRFNQAIMQANRESMILYSKKAVESGKKALALESKIGIEPEIGIKRTLRKIEKMYEMLQNSSDV